MHTQGAWWHNNGFILGTFDTDGEVHDVCDPHCAPIDCSDEMEANARLIAKAPELLQVARSLGDQLALMAGGRNDYRIVQLDALVEQVTKGEVQQPEPSPMVSPEPGDLWSYAVPTPVTIIRREFFTAEVEFPDGTRQTVDTIYLRGKLERITDGENQLDRPT